MSNPESQSTSASLETQAYPSRPPNAPSSTGRWLRRGLVLAVVLATIGIAVGLVPTLSSSQDSDQKLTYTIQRGDLVVAVTEQGTLESSNNTEIKCKVRGFSTVTFVIKGGTMVQPGDELVRLDTKVIEENLSLTKTNTHIARATLERTKADVAKAEIAIEAYKKGRYLNQMKALDRELAITTTNLNTARKMLQQSELLFRQGYVTDLEVAGAQFTVKQADLELNVTRTRKNVLEKYTRAMELETMNGNLTATKSKLQADEAGLKMEIARRDRAMEELQACVIKAEGSGMVIYPSAAAWKNSPDITEGATVRKDQVLLLMPDLTKMQVKVGIHESIIDRVAAGLTAKVTLPDRTLEAQVTKVAAVTRPAGWWTGNVVKYDTVIELPSVEGLKPGMSAEVEVILARHTHVLMIPVAAVVETTAGDFCWVKTNEGEQRRSLQLGDTNDVFIVVEAGLKEGDEVLLNPTSTVEEAQAEAAKTIDKRKTKSLDLESPQLEGTDHGN